MSTAEKIFIKAQRLPDAAQQTVLHLVERLAANPNVEENEWSKFSFASALQGMEDEDWSDLTNSKNFEKWQ